MDDPKALGRQKRGNRNQRRGKGKLGRKQQEKTRSVNKPENLRGKSCIILLGGSFNPPHKAHFELLNLSKSILEKKGLMVEKCHMVPSTDKYLSKKLVANNNDFIIPASHRIAMCKEGALEYGEWLNIPKIPYVSVTKFLKNNYKYKQNRIVFMIRGEDKWNPKYAGKNNTGNVRSLYVRRDGSSNDSKSIEFIHDKPLAPGLSSTEIRKLLISCLDGQVKFQNAIEKLVKSGKLNPSVGKYLLAHQELILEKSE
jgi:hypothetical protein